MARLPLHIHFNIRWNELKLVRSLGHFIIANCAFLPYITSVSDFININPLKYSATARIIMWKLFLRKNNNSGRCALQVPEKYAPIDHRAEDRGCVSTKKNTSLFLSILSDPFHAFVIFSLRTKEWTRQLLWPAEWAHFTLGKAQSMPALFTMPMGCRRCQPVLLSIPLALHMQRG